MLRRIRTLAAHMILVPTLMIAIGPTGAAAASTAEVREGVTVYSGGLRTYRLYDGDCAWSPDSMAVYEEFWDEEGNFVYDVYRGHSAYYCGPYPGTYFVQADSGLEYCSGYSPWGCPILDPVDDYHD